MNNCEKYKNLVEKYLDGMITDVELSQLQKHAEECSSCRTEFDRSISLKDAVKQAFSSHTSAEQAGELLVTKLPSEPDRKPLSNHTVLFAGKRAAIAAIALLAAGVLLGFALGRTGEPTGPTLNDEVPISVGKIEGTMLVRHEGS
ncbi:MAG: zf-HC2 domain-containing protein, partial [Phycisphaerales bacterium]